MSFAVTAFNLHHWKYFWLQNDSVCSQRLLLSDSIDTIDTIYSAVTNVWSTADCDSEWQTSICPSLFFFSRFFPPKFHFFITFSKIGLLLPVPKESRGSWLKVKGIYKNRNVNIMMGTSIQSVSTSVISNWTFVYHWEHT